MCKESKTAHNVLPLLYCLTSLVFCVCCNKVQFCLSISLDSFSSHTCSHRQSQAVEQAGTMWLTEYHYLLHIWVHVWINHQERPNKRKDADTWYNINYFRRHVPLCYQLSMYVCVCVSLWASACVCTCVFVERGKQARRWLSLPPKSQWIHCTMLILSLLPSEFLLLLNNVNSFQHILTKVICIVKSKSTFMQ